MDNFDTKLFRKRAVERYRESRGKARPPRFAAPRVHLYIGILCALLTSCALLIWATRAPVYVSAKATAVAGEKRFGQLSDRLILLVFIPVAYVPSLKVGQKVYFNMNSHDQLMSGTLTAFEPQVINQSDVSTRYDLVGGMPLGVNEPVVVGIALIELPPSNKPPALHAGSTFDVKIEIGSKRLTSLIPLLNRLFDK